MDNSLHLYARCGRADAIRIQLRHGADTEVRDAQGLTPLLLAARYNQMKVLQVLLQHGARTDAYAPLDTDFGHGVELGTCLHFAVESGHVQILKFLVTAAALDVHERTSGSQEMTPLHLAARLGRADVVRFLVARIEDINVRDAHGMTALHHACDYPNALSNEVPRITSSSPPQYLFDAAHVEVVNVLLDAGAEMDTRRSSDWATPLRCAIHRGHFLVAKTLVDHGANSGVAWWFHKFKMMLWPRDQRRHSDKRVKRKINWKRALRMSSPTLVDFAGWTALHIAASSGWQAGLALLIAHGANVELTTTESEECGITALHLAAQNGHYSSVSTLLDAGAGIHVCDDLGDAPLLCALRHGRSRIVKLLLRHGAKCEYHHDTESISLSSGSESILGSFDPRKTSALHLAAFFGLLPVVQELVKASSNLFAIDAVDDDGATPLWLAALAGHLDVVDFLAQQGANIHHYVAGASASGCAAEFGYLEVVEYISTSSPERAMLDRL
ncbi:Hypothetical protein PHPALM_3409 [Phytophthora palmivora]|uniref:Uncharacterized protein n=1 Tax=Phytophthora palmivora TaxID=4796 RepID=A0A2P4YMG9_9STRA|nr:Hypothetical protein PHPALM_3409 [Phytophthora palmivora]